MPTVKFDPFEDRLSRDIRNGLSEALMQTLQRMDMRPVRQAAARYLAMDKSPVYAEYITDRLQRYAAALTIIRRRKTADAVSRALVLWDQELFFEVHELLEGVWMSASGAEKKVLQALIRAAGVYVHLARGNATGAQKMAAKAVAVLTENREAAPPGLHLDRLLDALRRLDPVPPRLSCPPY